ncbi:transcriptional regulator [Erwinia sp. J316]|uniref:Transcriptional regulator n=2 Tax=Erwinia sorbitola TaxID=2681984 RepID=A0A6I6EMG0_9GAMM|nr:transcriptional regulator [Erwinia sorbitola]QGU89748.1 transcriptional regulator [Erwinia sorbitola]
MLQKAATGVQNSSSVKDWHREEIKCAIRLRGYSIAGLSRAHGLADGTLANALVRPWPKGEKIIATLIGLDPAEIWPSRYAARKAKLVSSRVDLSAPCLEGK